VGYTEDWLAEQVLHREAFGKMLLVWRKRNGWTQYTGAKWGEEAGFSAISYGNLSVIENGKAGELRQKAFFQLAEMNKRIAEKEWGDVKCQEVKAKLRGAEPIGDDGCPVWGMTEFLNCYIGQRAVPGKFKEDVAPKLNQRHTAEIVNTWRREMRILMKEHQLSYQDSMGRIISEMGEKGEKFVSVISGFDTYTPSELQELWDHKEQEYWPKRILRMLNEPKPRRETIVASKFGGYAIGNGQAAGRKGDV